MQSKAGSTLLAIFGIDGSGKSVLLKEILKRNSVQTIICPRYHEKSVSPFSELSETLNLLNQLGDDLNCFELKAMAVYFQLTLYRPVLDFEMKQTVSDLKYPGAIISERHPLVDSMIYGPFFAKKIMNPISEDFIQQNLIPALAKAKPRGFQLFEAWFEEENFRMVRNTSLRDFPMYLKSVFSLGASELFQEVQRHFRVQLPEQAVFLDIEIDLALEYIRERSTYRESHENHEGLSRLKEGYIQVFKFLSQYHPEMRLSVIKPIRGQSIVSLADQVLSLL